MVLTPRGIKWGVSPIPSPRRLLRGGSSVLPPVSDIIGMWDASVFASLDLDFSNLHGIADISGGGNDMIKFGSGNWPQYSSTMFNGSFPGILITGTDICALGCPTPFPMGTGNTLTGWYVGTMAKFGASTTFGRTLSYSKPGARDDDNAGSWCVSAGASITTTHFVRNSVGPTSPVGTVFSAGHRFIHTIDASGVMTTYVDGVASATVVSVGNWVDGGTMRFGVDTTTAYWGGIVAEYGVKTNFTDAAGVAAFDAALKTKWGL